MDWKHDLYRKVAPHLAPHAIFASNTSGLSITELVRSRCPSEMQPRFCGVHFFNPPRYMHLVELIPTPTTEPRDPRRARGVPHHDARQGRRPREGHAELHRQPRRRLLACSRRSTTPRRFGLGFDVVDALTGTKHRPRQERAPSAPPTSSASTRSRTSSRRCRTPCRTIDPFFASFATPPVLQKLIDAGRARARRRGAGFYKKVGKDILRLDPAKGDYVPARRQGRRDRRAHPEEAAGRAPRSCCTTRRTRRRSSCGRSCATASTTPPCTSPTIADNARDVDLAMRWGFGCEPGPVRALAGGRLAAGRAVDRGRHRRRQGAQPARRCRRGCSTARSPTTAACTARRARSAGARRASCRARTLAGLPAPAVPRDAWSAPTRRRR